MPNIGTHSEPPDDEDSDEANRLDAGLAGLLDSLPQQIVVVDRSGVIIGSNSAWKLAIGTTRAALFDDKTAANYLTYLQNHPVMERIASGLENVLCQRMPRFEAEFPRSPRASGTCRLTVVRWSKCHAILIHEPILQPSQAPSDDDAWRFEMAQEIHDGLSQVVGGMVLSLAVLNRTMKNEQTTDTKEVGYLLDLAKLAAQQVRELSGKLKNP